MVNKPIHFVNLNKYIETVNLNKSDALINHLFLEKVLDRIAWLRQKRITTTGDRP